MPLLRHMLDHDERGTYHVLSRCVRRAFLCDDQAEHTIDEQSIPYGWVDWTNGHGIIE